MKLFVLCSLLALAAAQPAKNDLWKGSSMDQMVDQTKIECAQKNDEVSCMKFKVLNLLDQIFRKDSFKASRPVTTTSVQSQLWFESFRERKLSRVSTPSRNLQTSLSLSLCPSQVSETVEVTRNSYPVEEVSGRSEGSFLENVQTYLSSHDVTFKLPMESSVKVSARNIDDDQLTFDVKFGQGRAVEEARKSKLKKVVIPILVFVLLKAMTLIPLAIGVLGLKAWNALQLSFFSFIVAVGMAIFQLCKKIAADSHGASLSAHGPWEYQAQYRSFQDDAQPSSVFAQNLAYSAHAQS
ncbi:hypothetical protein WN48_06917 [Eufriesea mexicana]|uniref:Osiris 19 n=1 Tax=Eufriesea mexicana TaxID=516756 RepID=A0A310SIV7_9HYME|nr:hypothetical protein WN48_06917 [Eufriesea mexicana]